MKKKKNLILILFYFQNTPNDLQLISDAPAHHIFALLGPVDPNQTSLPEVLCVLQVSRKYYCTTYFIKTVLGTI